MFNLHPYIVQIVRARYESLINTLFTFMAKERMLTEKFIDLRKIDRDKSDLQAFELPSQYEGQVLFYQKLLSRIFQPFFPALQIKLHKCKSKRYPF